MQKLESLQLKLPVYVTLPKKTKKNERFYLNQNKFRNTMHFKMNTAKTIYTKHIEKITEHVNGCFEDPVVMTFTMYPPSKRRMDLTNVCSAVEKFTNDALVKVGILIDDDYTHVKIITYCFGEVDKKDPRVELNIQTDSTFW